MNNCDLKNKDVIFRSELPADKQKIDSLVKLSFEGNRNSRAVSILRKNQDPVNKYSVVAINNGNVVGTLRFSYVMLPSKIKAPLLGPLAVARQFRGYGLGNALVERGLNKIAGNEHGVLIVGKLNYYDIYGFEFECVQNLKLKGDVLPLEFMGLEFEYGFFEFEKGFVKNAK